jgi:hypothetical protein
MDKIYETVVYCGRMKEYRILNLTTGSIYSMSYEDSGSAFKDINDEEMRFGKRVTRLRLENVQEILNTILF